MSRLAQAQALEWPSARSSIQLDHLGHTTQVGHEIQHDNLVLVRAGPEPPPELLHEDAPTMGGTHEDDHIDVRHVDPLVEEVNGGDKVELARPEPRHDQISLARRHLARNMLGPQVVLSERGGH